MQNNEIWKLCDFHLKLSFSILSLMHYYQSQKKTHAITQLSSIKTKKNKLTKNKYVLIKTTKQHEKANFIIRMYNPSKFRLFKRLIISPEVVIVSPSYVGGRRTGLLHFFKLDICIPKGLNFQWDITHYYEQFLIFFFSFPSLPLPFSFLFLLLSFMHSKMYYYQPSSTPS